MVSRWWNASEGTLGFLVISVFNPWKPSQNSGKCPIRFWQVFNSTGIVLGLKASFVIAVFIRSKFKLENLSFSSQDAQKQDLASGSLVPTLYSSLPFCLLNKISQITWDPPTGWEEKLLHKLKGKARVGGCCSKKTRGPERVQKHGPCRSLLLSYLHH